MAKHTCQSCGSKRMEVFYETKQIPVHSCLLMDSREEALNFPKRDLALGFCQECGFIQNVLFDPAMSRYSTAYEEQQAFSPRFREFSAELVNQLVARYGLKDKRVVEIGCGKGDFLVELCQAGKNTGIGIDPSYIPERVQAERVSFVQELYSEKHASYEADMVCCRHTLEHIPDTKSFMQIVRKAAGERHDAVIFFEVPDIGRVLREVAFWDIYYEHCSYFSLGSLARLFRATGFDVLQLAKVFDQQYLLLDAVISNGHRRPALPEENDMEELRRDVAYFAANIEIKRKQWREDLNRFRAEGKRVAIWGSGSKCVAFLSTLGIQDEIDMIVDINPYRHGRYLAGSGKEVSSPSVLREFRPDVVVPMNAIYMNEIRRDLETMELESELMPV